MWMWRTRHGLCIYKLEKMKVPKETNPPLVLKSSKGSPLNSGGGMGDQQQGGAFAHSLEFPTSISSWLQNWKEFTFSFQRCNKSFNSVLEPRTRCLVSIYDPQTWKKAVAIITSDFSLKRIGKIAMIFFGCQWHRNSND